MFCSLFYSAVFIEAFCICKETTFLFLKTSQTMIFKKENCEIQHAILNQANMTHAWEKASE